MLYCRAALGTVVDLDDENKPHHTVYCPKGPNRKAWGGFLSLQEWCVRNPKRVTLMEIHLVPNPRFKKAA